METTATDTFYNRKSGMDVRRTITNIVRHGDGYAEGLIKMNHQRIAVCSYDNGGSWQFCPR